MLIYASKLQEEEMPLGHAERDETLHGRDSGEGRAQGSGVTGRRV